MNGLLILDQVNNQGRTAPQGSAHRMNFDIRNAHLANRNARILRMARAQQLPNELSGIWDDLKAAVSPYIAAGGAKLKNEFQEKLSAAQTQLESKLGEFLTTGQTLVDLKARAQAQQNSPKSEVKSRAVAITAKAQALQTNYESIKAGAIAATQNLVTLKNAIESSPVFNFDDPMSAGTRVVELFNQFKNQIGTSISQTTSVVGRIAAHNKEVKQLSSDVESLENYAQGKGFSAAISQATSFYGDTMSSVVKIAAVGALVYFLAPSLIGRVSRARA